MLDFLGLPYIQAEGEAEAMCAFLNEQGVMNKSLCLCSTILILNLSKFVIFLILLCCQLN